MIFMNSLLVLQFINLVLSPVRLVLKFHTTGRRHIKSKFIYSRKVSTSIPLSIHETPKSSKEIYVDFLNPDSTKSDNKYGIYRQIIIHAHKYSTAITGAKLHGTKIQSNFREHCLQTTSCPNRIKNVEIREYLFNVLQ